MGIFRRCFAACAIVMALIAAPAAPASAASPLPAWSDGRVGAFMDHFSDTPFDVATEARRRRIIELNAWQWPLIDDIKRANPDALVMVYKSMASTRSGGSLVVGGRDADLLPTGVGYMEAHNEHPEWFATVNGRRLEWTNWPEYWMMRVDNVGYQNRWLANVTAELREYGWDGVIMDDLLVDNEGYTNPGPYSSDTAMRSAMRSFLAKVGPGITAAGFVAAANIPAAYSTPGLWADWIQFLDAGVEEHFTNWSGTAGSGFVWDWGTTGYRAHIEEVATAERMGKIAMVKIGGVAGDRAAALYGLASYFLVNGGRTVISHGDSGWEPEFEWRLGRPLGAYRDLGNSVFRRDFSGGVALVNAAQSRTATIALGGQYRNAAGQIVTSVTLGAQRGAILRKP